MLRVVLALSWVIFLLFASRAIADFNFTLYYLLESALLLFSSLTLLIFYLSLKHKPEYTKLNKTFCYSIALCLAISLYPAIAAKVTFNQSIIMGLLVSRVSLLTTISFFCIYPLTQIKFTAASIKSATFYFSFILTLTWILINYALDPLQFIDTNLVDIRSDGSLRFRLSPFFPTILLAASLALSSEVQLKKLKIFYYSISILSICYIVFLFRGRTFLVACAAAYFLYFFRSLIHQNRKIIFLTLSFFYLIAAIYISFNADSLIRSTSLLAAVFDLDASTSSRINQLNSIGNDLTEHIFFGNGLLSQQGEITYESRYGVFYPADLGIFGAIYIYGVVPTVIMLIFLSFIWCNSFAKNNSKEYTIIFSIYFIYSFVTGVYFINPFYLLLILMINQIPFSRPPKITV